MNEHDLDALYDFADALGTAVPMFSYLLRLRATEAWMEATLKTAFGVEGADK